MSDYQIDPTYNANDIMKVMKIIRDKKASYPSEIAQIARLNKDYVFAIIGYLIGEEYIEWISLLDPSVMDERLMYRRADMFARGIQGYGMWRRFNWVGFRDWELHYELDAIERWKKENQIKGETEKQESSHNQTP